MVPVILHHDRDPLESSESSYTRNSNGYATPTTNTSLPTSSSPGSRSLDRRDASDARIQSSRKPAHAIAFAYRETGFDRSVSPSTSDGSLDDEIAGVEIPDEHYEAYRADALPATSSDFAELFPSNRLISIKHDDTTMDGNMNLRLDTRVDLPSGRKRDITLFHLRMYDLKGRSFSLRRYCRDSGREICHSNRKEQKHPLLRRPTLPRSLSNAFSGIISKSDHAVQISSPKAINRVDSGYDSADDDGIDTADDAPSSPSKQPAAIDPDLISLEFSNYAHVNVKRKGMKNAKRYEFEYWGAQYSWRRVVRKLDAFKEVSFHLIDHDSNIVAHIVPTPLDKIDAREEIEKGGWVPPCSLWLSDEKLYRSNDVADVIVSTGVTVLVDDCIRRRFQSKEKKQLIMAAPPNLESAEDVQYTGRKNIINETMRRPLSPTSPAR